MVIKPIERKQANITVLTNLTKKRGPEVYVYIIMDAHNLVVNAHKRFFMDIKQVGRMPMKATADTQRKYRWSHTEFIIHKCKVFSS